MEENREPTVRKEEINTQHQPLPAPRKPGMSRWGGFLCGFAAAVVVMGALALGGVLRTGAPEPQSAPAAAPAVSDSDAAEGTPAETPGEVAAQQESGFETPEAAVEAYLNGLQQADVSAMLNAFAVEKYIEKYNMSKSLERIGAYFTNMQPRFPSTSEFTRVLNVEQRRGELAKQIGFQYLALSNPEEQSTTEPVPLETQAEIDALLNRLGDPGNMEILQSTQLVKFENSAYLHELYTTPQNQQILSRKAEYLGCETVGSMSARVKVEGVEYLFCFDAGRYDGRWYLTDISGNIGALLGISPQYAGVIPISGLEEE